MERRFTEVANDRLLAVLPGSKLAEFTEALASMRRTKRPDGVLLRFEKEQLVPLCSVSAMTYLLGSILVRSLRIVAIFPCRAMLGGHPQLFSPPELNLLPFCSSDIHGVKATIARLGL
jgi:hypothetical protein